MNIDSDSNLYDFSNSYLKVLEKATFENVNLLRIQRQSIKSIYFGRVKDFMSFLRHAVSANDDFLNNS